MKPKRIQVVVLGCIIQDNKILLTKRDEPGDHSDKLWDIPGGGLDFGETTEQALIREIKEETNLTLNSYHVLPKVHSVVHGTWQGVFVSYICSVSLENHTIVLNKEASEYGWFSEEEIKTLKSASLVLNVATLAFRNIHLLK